MRRLPTTLLLLLAGLGACGGPEAGAVGPATSPSEHWGGSLAPPPASKAPEDRVVVAEVDGRAIYAADVARQAKARGLTARAALEELVTFELLAGEAARRGLADDPAVVEARRRERVRALLTTGFVPTFDGPEDVPDDEVAQIAKRPDVRAFFNHDAYHEVRYARVPVKKGAPPVDDEEARRHAEELYRRAVAAKPPTEEAFAALVTAFNHDENLKVQSAKFVTTLAGPARPEFARAAFSVEKIGDVAKPVRTPWGWDVLYLDHVLPAVQTPPDLVEEGVRQRAFQNSQRTAFLSWVDGFLARHQVLRNDAALEEPATP